MIMGYDMYRNLTNTTARKFKAKQQQIFQEALVNPGPDIVSTFCILQHFICTYLSRSEYWNSRAGEHCTY